MPEQRVGQVPAEGGRERGWTVNPEWPRPAPLRKRQTSSYTSSGLKIPHKPLTSWVTLGRFFICRCLCFLLLGIELKTVHASWGCRKD